MRTDNESFLTGIISKINKTMGEVNVGRRSYLACVGQVDGFRYNLSCEKELPSGDPQGVFRKLKEKSRNICEGQWGP